MRLRTDWHRWAIDEIAHPLVGSWERRRNEQNAPHRGRLVCEVGRSPFASATIKVGGFPVTKSTQFV